MHIMTNGHFPYPGDDHRRGEKAFHMVKRTHCFLQHSEVCLLQKTECGHHELKTRVAIITIIIILYYNI